MWGFGAKWLPTLLGTPPPNKRVLALAVMLHGIAIALALAGLFRITTALIVISSLLAIISLRLFARPERPAKTKGIHGSFPVFVRVAYVWLRRNEIERLFRRLKGFRRIFSRFDKLDLVFLAFLHFALIVEALRYLISVNTP